MRMAKTIAGLAGISALSVVFVAGIAGSDFASAGAQAIEAPVIEPGNCSDLDKLDLGDARVGSATGVVTEGAYFCRVAGVSRPTDSSYINFEIWLPPPSRWNGKIYSSSGGSGLGGIKHAEMRAAFSRGYAAMSSDLGHAGRDDRGAPFAGDGTWALGQPEKIVDFAYRGQHLSTVATKDIVAAYYGRAADRAYFESCSMGGYHALAQAERYPDDFDGIIAAAPATRVNYALTNILWQMMPGRRSEANKLSNDKLATLHRAAVQHCDALDGVQDGLIADPLSCSFDPAVLQCTGEDGADCLTPAQVQTARHFYSGPSRADGTPLAPGLGAPPGSELEWSSNINSTRPTMIFHFFQYWVAQDPDYDVAQFDFDADFDAMRAQPLPGGTFGSALDNRGDLTAFHQSGGKLIMWSGGEDTLAPPGTNPAYREAVARNLGDAGNVDDVMRVFIAPGVAHCGGGTGPDQFDMLGELERWVEEGDAPARIEARQLRRDGSVARSIPLCRYPQVARYDGSGSVLRSENFTCE